MVPADSPGVDGGAKIAEVNATVTAVGVDLGVQPVGNAEQLGQRVLTERACEVVFRGPAGCGRDALGPLATCVDTLFGDVNECVVRQRQLRCRDERRRGWFGGQWYGRLGRWCESTSMALSVALISYTGTGPERRGQVSCKGSGRSV